MITQSTGNLVAGKWQWETAKAAIDYLKGHSGHPEKPHIRFYGGEPLLNFELIKRSIQYAKYSTKNCSSL